PWTLELQERTARSPTAPRVVAAGPLLSTVDFWLNLPDQRQFIYMSDEAAVRAAVRAHKAWGAAAIKVWYIMPPQPPDTARVSALVHAAGDEAREVGLPLSVHATGLWQGKQVRRASARGRREPRGTWRRGWRISSGCTTPASLWRWARTRATRSRYTGRRCSWSSRRCKQRGSRPETSSSRPRAPRLLHPDWTVRALSPPARWPIWSCSIPLRSPPSATCGGSRWWCVAARSTRGASWNTAREASAQVARSRGWGRRPLTREGARQAHALLP